MKIKPLASGSAGNCYYIFDGESSLLIEAGLPIKKIKECLNYRLSEIDGCLISHEHGDHSKAVQDLCNAGIDCYMSYGTKKALDIQHHRIKTFRHRHPVNINTFVVKPFSAEHDAEDPVNFLIWSKKTRDKMVYLTDTYYCKHKFQALNYIMLEINYAADILNRNVEEGIVPEVHKNRVIKSHMSLKTAKDFLKANDLSQVKEIWLIHLSSMNSDEERFKEEIKSLTGKPVYVA